MREIGGKREANLQSKDVNFYNDDFLHWRLAIEIVAAILRAFQIYGSRSDYGLEQVATLLKRFFHHLFANMQINNIWIYF